LYINGLKNISYRHKNGDITIRTSQSKEKLKVKAWTVLVIRSIFIDFVCGGIYTNMMFLFFVKFD